MECAAVNANLSYRPLTELYRLSTASTSSFNPCREPAYSTSHNGKLPCSSLPCSSLNHGVPPPFLLSTGNRLIHSEFSSSCSYSTNFKIQLLLEKGVCRPPWFRNFVRQSQVLCMVGRPKGRKTEEMIRKEVGVVMIQLSKLTPNGQQTVRTTLRKYAKKIGPECVLGSLWELIRRQDWQRAHEAFETIRVMQWYVPDVAIYSHLIALMGKAGQVELAINLFDSMAKQGCSPETSACTAMIDILGKSRRQQEALDLFREMKERPGCEPDESTYSTAMRMLSRAGRLEDAERLLEEMEVHFCVPNEVHYNILMDGWGRLGDIEKMQQKFLDMRSAGCQPDVWAYNSLVRNFGRAGLLEAMEACFESMQTEGCAPDHNTFLNLIDGYSRWGELEKMSRSLKHMLVHKYRLGPVTFNTVIDAYGKARRIGEMEYAFRTMKLSGVKPTAVTFCTLINAYGHVRDVDRIGRLLRQMEATGVEPETAVYNAAIEAYGNVSALRQVGPTLAWMEEQGCAPDAGTLCILVGVYAKHRQFEKAVDLFEEFRERGIEPPTAAYNALMAEYARTGQHHKVTQVWGEVLRSPFPPDADTFGCLIEAYSRAGMVERMAKAHEEMRGRGCRGTPNTFAALAVGYADAGEVDPMERTLKVMVREGVVPTTSTLSRVAVAYARGGFQEASEAVVEEIHAAKGCAPFMTYVELLWLWGFRDMVEMGEEREREVEGQKELPLTLKTPTALMLLIGSCKSIKERKALLWCLGGLRGGKYKGLTDLLEGEGVGMEVERLWGANPRMGTGALANVPNSRGEGNEVGDGSGDGDGGRGGGWQGALECLDKVHEANPKAQHLNLFYTSLMEAAWTAGLKALAAEVLKEAVRRGAVKHPRVPAGALWSLSLGEVPQPLTELVVLVWLRYCQLALTQEAWRVAGKERKLEKVMIHDPRPVVYQARSISLSCERKEGVEEGAEKVLGEGGQHPMQILLERFGAIWFRNEGKGRLVAVGEEFSQWLTRGGGPEIQLVDIPHFVGRYRERGKGDRVEQSRK